MAVDIQTPTGFIRASDRNKYIGGVFYEALLNFPVIQRTIGDWLAGELEFSSLELELSNVDGRFNNFLPGGANFGGWIGKTVEVKIGLRDVASTYKTIFSGFVSDVGGFGRTVKTIRISARDKFDKINVSFPPAVFTSTTFPDIDNDVAGLGVPVIYGDWTVEVNPGGSVPAFPVNGADPDVNGNSSHTNNVQLRISDNSLTLFDNTTVHLKRGDVYFLFASADITNVPLSNNAFEIIQNGVTLVEGNPYEYDSGDSFFVKVKGKDLGSYDDNIVEIARDILMTYGGLTPPDFDSSWNTVRDKNSPVESAIVNFKSRVWLQEAQPCLTFALSLLEQVRCEVFVDRNLKFKISTLHLDSLDPSPSYRIRNWDVVKDSFSPHLDERNNFNRVQGVYSFLPDLNENSRKTPIHRNSAAVNQAGKEIFKEIVFPNLYEEFVVINQLKEMLRLASAYLEIIDVELTWRSVLLDISDMVKLNVQIGSSIYSDVPCLVRQVGYDPAGLKIPATIWSFQMVPFPGWSPGYTGITGGTTAVITQES
jgi:hypothetical protein